MRLGLSAAAAPDASPAELVELCTRRGLMVLELVDDVPAEAAHLEFARYRGDTVVHAGMVLPVMRGPADAWVKDVASTVFAWEVDPAASDIAADAELVLPLEGLCYIRLVGGGPETTLHEGRGIGTVMGRLALAGYNGPLVMTPSSPRYRIAWQTWLGRRGGTGCGSKGADMELVKVTG